MNFLIKFKSGNFSRGTKFSPHQIRVWQFSCPPPDQIREWQFFQWKKCPPPHQISEWQFSPWNKSPPPHQIREWQFSSSQKNGEKCLPLDQIREWLFFPSYATLLTNAFQGVNRHLWRLNVRRAHLQKRPSNLRSLCLFAKEPYLLLTQKPRHLGSLHLDATHQNVCSLSFYESYLSSYDSRLL